MNATVRRWFDEERDVSVLGVARVAFGILLAANAVRALRELGRGYFGDVFHWPLLPEALVPSRSVYAAIVATQLLLALVAVAGRWRSREALLASAVLGTYVLLCDRLQFHHNRWALFCQAFLLSFAPCDRSYRLGPRLPSATAGPLWAARLVGLQLSIIYLASGGSKLLDADWRSGLVLLERFHLYASQAIAAGVPAGVVDVLARPASASVLAKGAIATELFLAFGLWPARTRLFALCWGTAFHLVIEATSRVESFTWLVLASYLVFVRRLPGRVGGAASRPHWWSTS
ncbi:MAG TPA: HTTM domain-containing protein [Polyangiaceae bacterium]